MHAASFGVLYSFLIVINGYRIREPGTVFELVSPEFPLEVENVIVSATENATLGFDNFTISGNCPCLDVDYTCWLFYLDLNEVVPLGCNPPYDVNVVDDSPPMHPMVVWDSTNETTEIYNLTGPGTEMTTLDPAKMDPDCWLLPLDSVGVLDCPLMSPKVNGSLMIINDTEPRGRIVDLYPPVGGPMYDDLDFLGGPLIDVIDHPVGEPNETFPMLVEYFPDDSSRALEMAFTECLEPSIFNDTYLIALPDGNPTMNINQNLPRLPKPTGSKFHYTQAVNVLHPVQHQDRVQNQNQIKPINRIPTSGTINFKESTNQNKNMLVMAMERPQTTQLPPPASSPKPTGGKKRKKAKTTVTTSTSTVPPTSTTKKGLRKRKVTKTTTASTTASTTSLAGVVTTRKKMKRTRTTVSADSLKI